MHLESKRIQSDKRPHKRAKNQENINRSEQVIFESKLDGCEGKIENEVERKWQCHQPRDLPGYRLVKYGSKRNSDNRIENCPYRPEKPARRCPVWFDKCLIPIVCFIHILKFGGPLGLSAYKLGSL